MCKCLRRVLPEPHPEGCITGKETGSPQVACWLLPRSKAALGLSDARPGATHKSSCWSCCDKEGPLRTAQWAGATAFTWSAAQLRIFSPSWKEGKLVLMHLVVLMTLNYQVGFFPTVHLPPPTPAPSPIPPHHIRVFARMRTHIHTRFSSVLEPRIISVRTQTSWI